MAKAILIGLVPYDGKGGVNLDEFGNLGIDSVEFSLAISVFCPFWLFADALMLLTLPGSAFSPSKGWTA